MKILICAIRGRSKGDWHTSKHTQTLEIGGGVSNSLTSVAKDSYVIEIYDGQGDSDIEHYPSKKRI